VPWKAAGDGWRPSVKVHVLGPAPSVARNEDVLRVSAVATSLDEFSSGQSLEAI